MLRIHLFSSVLWQSKRDPKGILNWKLMKKKGKKEYMYTVHIKDMDGIFLTN